MAQSSNMEAPDNRLKFTLIPETKVQESPVAKPTSDRKPLSLLHFFTGAVAGAVSRTATCPLERLKILRQTSVKAYSKLTITQSLIKMYRKEGFIGFYKGNGVNVIRASPCAALEFL